MKMKNISKFSPIIQLLIIKFGVPEYIYNNYYLFDYIKKLDYYGFGHNIPKVLEIIEKHKNKKGFFIALLDHLKSKKKEKAAKLRKNPKIIKLNLSKEIFEDNDKLLMINNINNYGFLDAVKMMKKNSNDFAEYKIIYEAYKDSENRIINFLIDKYK